jgi:hypothetical protein
MLEILGEQLRSCSKLRTMTLEIVLPEVLPRDTTQLKLFIQNISNLSDLTSLCIDVSAEEKKPDAALITAPQLREIFSSLCSFKNINSLKLKLYKYFFIKK